MTTDFEIVEQWHAALNRGDVTQMMALVQPDVEIGGPRGVVRGAEILREWFGRAHVQMHPLAWYQRDHNIVVAERGEWRAPENGEITGTAQVATIFRVQQGRITAILRHEDLATALAAAGLSSDDLVQEA